jgi:hypothetical protein
MTITNKPLQQQVTMDTDTDRLITIQTCSTITPMVAIQKCDTLNTGYTASLPSKRFFTKKYIYIHIKTIRLLTHVGTEINLRNRKVRFKFGPERLA